MIPSELIEKLKEFLPSELASDVVDNFVLIKSDLSTETLERSAPGKFIETVVQILQFLEHGKYDKNPKVDDYLKNLESRSANIPDDLRITLARVARASYTLRSKRSIAHKGEVNPNIYDLQHLFSSSQWMLSELVRYLLVSDMSTASKLIEFIQIPVNILVEDFGDRRLVLKAGTAEEELLTLLFHYFPSPVLFSQIKKDMNRRANSTVSNAIRTIYRKRFIEGNIQQGYKLTSLGYKQSFEILRSKTKT
ncbi:MAG: hypothetical protein ISS58_08160 [Dehalococcoidales bacterium]|nr:hypothetical protein [Dehalococcoidales bacterium]